MVIILGLMFAAVLLVNGLLGALFAIALKRLGWTESTGLGVSYASAIAVDFAAGWAMGFWMAELPALAALEYSARMLPGMVLAAVAAAIGFGAARAILHRQW